MGSEIKQLLEFGCFRVDSKQRLLFRDQQPISLSPKAFDLLLVLVRHSGQVVLKDDLMKALWPDTFVEESNLGQHIFQLRKALSDRSQDSSHYIVTVPGRGYRFAQPVRTFGAGAEQSDEDVVIARHSRTRVVVEERGVEDKVDRKSDLEFFPEREPRMLPARATGVRWLGKQVAALVLAGVIGGALAIWSFFRPAPMPRVLHVIRLTHSGRVEPSGRVLGDGPRLYFTERLGGTWSLAQISERGGEPLQISTSVPNIAVYDIDPSRSMLLVGAQAPGGDFDDPLWVIATTGGSRRRVGDAFAGDAAWGPDGHTLAYCRKGELFVSGVDGQHARKFFSNAGHVFSPTWSPDGQRLSFTLRDHTTGTVSIWEIAADGRNPHPVSFGWKSPRSVWGEGECCGAWTPDGKYFVFRSVRENVQSFWMIRRKSTWFRKEAAPTQLYSSPDRIGEPRFSSDGKKILFIDYQERRELVRYDSTRKLFVPYLEGIAARHLSFSRDGQWVAYKNDVDNTLWRSRVDGSQVLQLTFPPLEVLQSTWSPDGKQIVFGAGGTLYEISSEGGNPVQITSGLEPNWSPDGRSVLFVRDSPTEAGGWHPSIYQLDWNTREARMIPGSESFEGPEWSPDGKYAAAADRRDMKLMLFDFARQQWFELADGLPYGWGIRWSADSKYVYYQHNYTGEEQPIFRVRLTDHRVEQITSSRQILRADVLSYTMTGLAPDDSPLASLIRRNSDIYALELELP